MFGTGRFFGRDSWTPTGRIHIEQTTYSPSLLSLTGTTLKDYSLRFDSDIDIYQSYHHYFTVKKLTKGHVNNLIKIHLLRLFVPQRSHKFYIFTCLCHYRDVLFYCYFILNLPWNSKRIIGIFEDELDLFTKYIFLFKVHLIDRAQSQSNIVVSM